MFHWIETTLDRIMDGPVAVSVRMMGEDEMSGLNASYRGRSGATNVLSFPADEADESGVRLLGDIAICTDVVAREAEEQKKPLSSHVAHMVVHGLLHLAGHDHEEENEAVEMERLETELLAMLGFSDPYEVAAEGELK